VRTPTHDFYRRASEFTTRRVVTFSKNGVDKKDIVGKWKTGAEGTLTRLRKCMEVCDLSIQQSNQQEQYRQEKQSLIKNTNDLIESENLNAGMLNYSAHEYTENMVKVSGHVTVEQAKAINLILNGWV
jgi:hypothetical protein